ncbi:LysM peptidoglycan-binding domain-containing protein [Lutibacter sp. B1]|uniref:PBP1 and LysM peptidoglycan-binding domain-containing protein n=1 Tax=Lutibacter sp. B1 TaxID=2725996 RepID=UPI001456526C|nr:LysM peptidoglycan-binding domain-containing protein [Lutibacter sp. B1]NLP58033.1 LysM peptidoglycan-binding domain-containing protein [Lutibacter sp. B1]
MKRIKLLIVFLFLFSAVITAQQKKYISYSVKKGETMKSIAKEYDLSTRDLLKLNPGISRKPDPNTVIIVPNKNYGKEVVEQVKTDDNLYLVKPKETLFGISKKFGVTIDDLIAKNPSLKEGLKVGMKLIIPKANVTKTTETLNYVIHTVVKDDTVYNLTKRYNVTVDQLLSLNPTLVEGLKLGMVLKIKPVTEIEETNNIEEEELDSNEAEIFYENLNLHKDINVVVMLPYQLNKLIDSTVISNFSKTNSLLNITTDFHLGVEMAIDSLVKKGVKIHVNYVDTENSSYKLKSIVNSIDFDKVDAVIGPLFFENAYWVAKHVSAPVIAPVYSKKQNTLSASNLIKSAPEEDLLEKKMLSYLEENYNGENIIVVNDGKTDSQSKLWRIVNILKSFDSIQNIAVIKPEKGYIASEKISQKLKNDSDNWVLLLSDEVLTTAATVNNLKVLDKEFKITLFALDKGENFDKVDNNFLGELNFVFPTTDFYDLDTKNTRGFYKSYKSKNNAIPSKYAIRGFDVAYDAIVRIASNKNLEDGLKAGKSTRISSTFDYNKKLFGSFENNGVFLIQYNKDLEAVILE